MKRFRKGCVEVMGWCKRGARVLGGSRLNVWAYLILGFRGSGSHKVQEFFPAIPHKSHINYYLDNYCRDVTSQYLAKYAKLFADFGFELGAWGAAPCVVCACPNPKTEELFEVTS